MTLNTGPAVSGKAAPLRGCVTIYVRWFPGDYLRDTTHLSLLEDGAYRRLLDLYYTQGKALTTNRKKLYRQLRVTDPLECAAVESVLEQYFYKRGKNLHNSRANAELLRNREITAVRVKGGKERAKRAAHAQHMLNSSSAIPYPEPEPDIRTPLPPTNVGASPHKVSAQGSVNGLQYIERYGQLIEITMGRHHRIPNLESTVGLGADYLVQWLTSKGFAARIVSGEKNVPTD